MRFGNIARLIRTLRPLKGSQLAYRAWYRFARPLKKARQPRILPELARVDSDVLSAAALRGQFAGGYGLEAPAYGEIILLNQRGQLDLDGPGWRLGPVGVGRLWTATLHYLGWTLVLAQDAASGDEHAARLLRDSLASWLRHCDLDSPGSRHLAWNPYATATRIANLAAMEVFGLSTALGSDLRSELLKSLWMQALWLSQNVEWDLCGNHLLRDAVGLAWAGRLFGGKTARLWMHSARRIALNQVREQVLEDGGHFERSPMYHAQIMTDLLELSCLLQEDDARSLIRDAWLRMAEYLAWMRHPDGAIALLNDAAFNGAPGPAEVFGAGVELGLAIDTSRRAGLRHFGDTGVVAWHGNPWTVFFDVGAVGPDCQPGHAHADTLSVECSIGDQRLFVDAGAHSYDLDERRAYDRSTVAHNTVCVDGLDSSEVWHIFRTGRRAKPFGVEIDPRPTGFLARASHDGYHHLNGKPVHTRAVAVDGDSLVIVDEIAGSGRHAVEAGLLLGLGWEVEPTPEGWKVSGFGGKSMWVRVTGPDNLRLLINTAMYHPAYGSEFGRPRLVWRLEADLPVRVVFSIEARQ